MYVHGFSYNRENSIASFEAFHWNIFEFIRSTVGHGLDSDAVINDNSTCGLPADDEPCNM